MKILSRDLPAYILIAVGGLLLTATLFDLLQPHLPIPGPAGISRRTERTAPRERRRPQPAARRPRPGLAAGMLTGAVLHNRGHYDYWVWAVKPEKKTSDRVRVEIAHAAAGPEGAFQILAFADTTGDGLPDTEIARSELFSAANPGDWSGFEFSAGEKAIFVGNAWPETDSILIYRESGEWPLPDPPFEGRFYHSLPPRPLRTAGPAFTNMRIGFLD